MRTFRTFNCSIHYLIKEKKRESPLLSRKEKGQSQAYIRYTFQEPSLPYGYSCRSRYQRTSSVRLIQPVSYKKLFSNLADISVSHLKIYHGRLYHEYYFLRREISTGKPGNFAICKRLRWNIVSVVIHTFIYWNYKCYICIINLEI